VLINRIRFDLYGVPKSRSHPIDQPEVRPAA
jgi:hypothetical protein